MSSLNSPAPAASAVFASAAALPALPPSLGRIVAMAKPNDPADAQGQKSPENEAQRLNQAFDGSGGPGAPGGGVPAEPASKAAAPRRYKLSAIRTREQFVSFLINQGARDRVVPLLARGVIDELTVTGDGVGDRLDEEEAVQGAVKALMEWKRDDSWSSRSSLPNFLDALSHQLADGDQRIVHQFRNRALYKIMLHTASQEFKKLPGYDRRSVERWFRQARQDRPMMMAEKRPSWQETSRQVRGLLELRAKTFALLRKDLSEAQIKALLNSEVVRLLGDDFSETAVLRAFNRFYPEASLIYGREPRVYFFEQDRVVVRFEALRDTVIERLIHDGYSRRGLREWFNGHRDEVLDYEYEPDDVIAFVERDLRPAGHR